MPSKEEKERRKQLIDSANEQAKKAFDESLPLSREQFKALFNFLDKALEKEACDDTLSYVYTWMVDNNLTNVDDVMKWLNEYGAYCDCEVLANVEEKFEGNNHLL